MKKTTLILVYVLITLINVSFASAQTSSALKGQSINGSTGLYSIPSARIGWESGNLGLDFGYRAVINNDLGVAHIPSFTASLFKLVEISSAYDFQPDNLGKDHGNDDLLLGVKFKLPTDRNTAIALGGNIQLLNISNNNDFGYNAYQPYIAITYTGTFFNMTAETTLAVGKTFYSGGPDNNSDIDFGMGFDLVLFPDVFANAVHWIIDFANFGYSSNSWPNNSRYHTGAVHRGILNTGFRIDLSAAPQLKDFKLIVDLVFNDLFDAGARSFTVGAVFGFNVS